MTRYFRQYTVSELNKFQDNVASYTCVCEAGLTGANCDQNINDCDPNSCQNGATCNVSTHILYYMYLL